SLAVAERRAIAARLMPEIRGRIGKQERKLVHFDDQDAVLEFVNSIDLRPLGALGTSCPDHFLLRQALIFGDRRGAAHEV
ncbi:hypothetical protein ACC754_43735, partial [Rhizobium johnstonii]